MTKTLKLSLVAAVAVAGISSANAKDLSEAIKDVDVSGTVVYRYNDYAETGAGDNNGTRENNYKIGLSLSSKVNDDVKANTRFAVESYSMDPGNSSDGNVDVKLTEVNFTYTGVQNLSLTVGKQGVNTPWTVSRDSLGTEQTGTGAVATYAVGPVTLVGAYYNQTNFGTDDELPAALGVDGSEDIYVVGAAATFGGVSIDAFYADLADIFDSYTVGLSASYDVAGVQLSPFARYTSLDADAMTTDNALWQVGTGASMGMFNAFVAYGQTDDEGGVVAVDGSAQTNMDYHWRVTAGGQADAEFLYAHVDADVTDTINLGVFYSEADVNAGTNEEEIYAQAKYQMSSNFYTYVRFGQYEKDGQGDQDMGRLHVQYSF